MFAAMTERATRRHILQQDKAGNPVGACCGPTLAEEFT